MWKLLVIAAQACALCACGSSVLVRQDDPLFAQAQQRLQQTAKTVDALNPSPEDRTLFLQAEAFFRYRFEPLPRSAASHAAEALAAITDFPAFQSLAGSLDLLDLRYRAPDSAVQLWETLLARSPQTPLRPLTLYRLGWVYRSAGASGLPRDSPNDAFDALISEQPASPYAAFAREAREVPWKSKSAAAARSLVPGLGQLYVGDVRGGWERFGIAVAALAAFAAPVYAATRKDGGLTWSSDWPLLALGAGGLVVLSIDYTSSYEDAMSKVVEWNERAEAEFNRGHPSAP